MLEQSSLAPALDLPTAEEARDLRLVALDMDGTLVRSDKTVNDEFWPVAEELIGRGIVLVAASGRQRGAIMETMAPVGDRITVLSENGAVAWQGEEVLRAETVDRETTVRVATAVRALAAQGRDTGLVAGAPSRAYVERSDATFLAHVRHFYPVVEVVDDLTDLPEDVVKLATWDAEPIVEAVVPALQALELDAAIVRSHEYWADVMRAGASKGAALTRLRESLGIPREASAAFGDHFNDLAMLQSVGMPFAVANAEPEIRSAARFVAPSNDEDGVMHVLRALLAA
ncbi:HAD family hydrolase [Georgenia sp. Z1344]|uniref:HAD family hydrolase n=1 Tax=Georgenia sp. Z1344 TaxID=3416706 RepID=UPI003CE77AD6